MTPDPCQCPKSKGGPNSARARFHLSGDVFVVPSSGECGTILYAPLYGNVLAVSSGVAQKLHSLATEPSGRDRLDLTQRAISELQGAGIIREFVEKGGVRVPRNTAAERQWSPPTRVTLFPTSRCNLRCVYCYADGGVKKTDMPEIIAKDAIDFVIANALEQKLRSAGVAFHGGGEPFVNMPLVKIAVSYARRMARKAGLRLHVSSATNGVLTTKQREWILANLSSVSISLDGPSDIQDKQRPIKSGRGSFAQVSETIRHFEDRKFSYSLRATITDDNVNRMNEIVDCVRAVSSVTTLHLEPVVCSSRALAHGISVANEAFATNFIEARRYARTFGIALYYSGGRCGSLTEHFCGGCGTNFFVTPDGYVSACLEVVDNAAPLAKHFIYGRHTPGGFEFNKKRLGVLLRRSVHRLPACRHCFAKYNCAGDCPVKVVTTGASIYDTSFNPRCATNRMILADELCYRAMNPEKDA